MTRPRWRAGIGPSARWAAVALAVLLVAGACGSTDVVAPSPRAPAADVVAYLAPPGAGFEAQLAADDRQSLEQGYADLLRGDLASARTAAASALSRDSRLAPARVLDAQAEFVAGRVATACERLREVVADAPGLDSALLLLGRCSELTADPVTAFVSYSALDLEVAVRRREALREAALQRALGGVVEALERGRIDLAEEWRDWLTRWAPGDPLEVQARLAIAERTGDLTGALETLRELERQGRAERPLLRRLAELETERGDPQAAIDLYAALVAADPGDPTLTEGLAAARFRFRMHMLPAGVGEAVQGVEVSRGDFAALLYWLVPGVRGARALSGVIVTDVTEEADHRQEIVRIVNLGLMDLADPNLREFQPRRPITRGAALASLLRLPEHLGVSLACAAPLARTPRPSSARVCEVAAACGLLDDGSECLPASPASGADAATWLRRTLELLD
ncbi:MAG TPA: tetratricopeptide repeat protein [Thermoanaerobaculia bacterium]|nr:tetratricopeptide repeat protein [Thermoanaerobaculia bacterium]